MVVALEVGSPAHSARGLGPGADNGEDVPVSPNRYFPVGRVYSPSSARSVDAVGKPIAGGDAVVFKVEAGDGVDDRTERQGPRPWPLLVYTRRKVRKLEAEAAGGGSRRRSRSRDPEVVRLDTDGESATAAAVTSGNGRMKLRAQKRRNFAAEGNAKRRRRRRRLSAPTADDDNASPKRAPADCGEPANGARRWIELGIKAADPNALIGLKCKVFWPLDKDWYKGSIAGYDSSAKKHQIVYDDSDKESLILANERVKVWISNEELHSLGLKAINQDDMVKDVYNELLAACINECQNRGPGDVVWAKLTGYAMWPAVVADESKVSPNRALKRIRADQSVLVQFFGTHDFARIKPKQAIPFADGLFASYHLKCKQARFYRSLDETKHYLNSHQLPEGMLRSQKSIIHGGPQVDQDGVENSQDHISENEARHDGADHVNVVPIEIGNLCVCNLGRIVSNSNHFHNRKHIWPEGYNAIRKFTSVKDPTVTTSYKMEVLRNPRAKTRPLFRVTSEDDEMQIDGPSPKVCWQKIYKKIKEKQSSSADGGAKPSKFENSGSYMFGFSIPQIRQLIQELPYSRSCSKYFEYSQAQSHGYQAVTVCWRGDRCCVCDTDEEYEDNVFLQCDKCRIMVHTRCYGEKEPLDGVLWLCYLCRPGAPQELPKCCLCPVRGGALKPTTDGQWAHLTCAIWIPETCLVDVTKMEPIDGIGRVNKGRWKLLCSICRVPYGACIQCSHKSCRVAYHPLCARFADLCSELEDEDEIRTKAPGEDDHSIRLLSFCKKHKQPSRDRVPIEDHRTSEKLLTHVQERNPSGCARTEPYNFQGRRGRRQPPTLAKRSYLENTPYIVSSFCQNGIGSDAFDQHMHHPIFFDSAQQESAGYVSSMSEKYKIMKDTFRRRLAFGKSRIHGFGVFAKLPHKAGDMVIEYVGEIVRPLVADTRERRTYNSLVGAGTYMFKIDDDHVVDATRAGSLAHLINHSCEPNCYSRTINVLGNDHIIIFAKRDIVQWEELTYDYRFSSIDEQLTCCCGSEKCRGVVNDVEAEDSTGQIWIPRSELLQLIGKKKDNKARRGG